MKIAVWGINYHPEKTGIGPCTTALCEHLALAGHEVTVVTTYPYYPDWKRRPAGIKSWECLNGVQIRRCWHYVPGAPTTLTRVLHELSFVLSSLAPVLRLKDLDCLIVISPPLPLLVAAGLFTRLRRVPCVFHLQDLQPDAAIRLGMLRSRQLITFLRWMELRSYRRASRISGISQGMIDTLRKRGLHSSKLLYLPNGGHPAENIHPGRFRARHGISQGHFVITYAGSLGLKHGLQPLIEAARKLDPERFVLLICGEGIQRSRLIQESNGTPQVRFLPLLPEVAYQELLQDSDLLAIPMAPNTGHSFFPSKFLQSCVAGRPVLAICDERSELATIILKYGCGIVAPPGQPDRIRDQVLGAVSQQDRLTEMALAAKRVGANFHWSNVLADFEQELQRISPAVEEKLAFRAG